MGRRIPRINPTQASARFVYDTAIEAGVSRKGAGAAAFTAALRFDELPDVGWARSIFTRAFAYRALPLPQPRASGADIQGGGSR